jgi:hypothetical protein
MDQAQNQLRILVRLQQRIGRADINGLIAMRSEVTASVAASQSVVQQAQQGTSASQTTEAAVQQASANARQTVSDFERDYYERHIFERYLTFSSAEDEEEYRKREQDRRTEIEKSVAEHTPQGDLRAANLSLDQLHDAGRHGASKSSEYSRWDKDLTGKRDALARAIDAKDKQVRTAPSSPDPLSDVQPEAKVSPEVLGSLRAAGVAIAADDAQGHGVPSATRGQTPERGRS